MTGVDTPPINGDIRGMVHRCFSHMSNIWSLFVREELIMLLLRMMVMVLSKGAIDNQIWLPFGPVVVALRDRTRKNCLKIARESEEK